MKTELHATSVTDVSFHFSELGCPAVTHPLNTFLPLTDRSYKPSLPLPSSPPQNQNLTSISSTSQTSFLYFSALRNGLIASPTPCIIATMSDSQPSPALIVLQPNEDNNIQGPQKPMFLISHFYFTKVQLRHGTILGDFRAFWFGIEFACNGA